MTAEELRELITRAGVEVHVRENPDDDREMQLAVVHPNPTKAHAKVEVLTVRHGGFGGRVGNWASGILKRTIKRAGKASK